MREIHLTILLSILVTSLLHGQVGARWFPIPHPPGATIITKIYEVPNSSGIIAIGASSGGYVSIWKSIDKGNSWEKTLNSFSAYGKFHDIVYDTTVGLLFAVTARSYNEFRTVYFSNDNGNSWEYINHPTDILGVGDAYSCVIHNKKIYILYASYKSQPQESILMALDYSNYHNPSSWRWFLVMEYPNDDIPYKLLARGDKLYVFNKVNGADSIRIHVHSFTDLETHMIPVETVSKMSSIIQVDTTGVIVAGPSSVYDVEVSDDKMYIGTDYTYGRVMVSLDNGLTWTNIVPDSEPWTKTYSLLVLGDAIYVGTDNGSVYKSLNGGITWDVTGSLQGASNVYDLYLSKYAYPNRILAGTGPNGRIFVTDSPVTYIPPHSRPNLAPITHNVEQNIPKLRAILCDSLHLVVSSDIKNMCINDNMGKWVCFQWPVYLDNNNQSTLYRILGEKKNSLWNYEKRKNFYKEALKAIISTPLDDQGLLSNLKEEVITPLENQLSSAQTLEDIWNIVSATSNVVNKKYVKANNISDVLLNKIKHLARELKRINNQNYHNLETLSLFLTDLGATKTLLEPVVAALYWQALSTDYARMQLAKLRNIGIKDTAYIAAIDELYNELLLGQSYWNSVLLQFNNYRAQLLEGAIELGVVLENIAGNLKMIGGLKLLALRIIWEEVKWIKKQEDLARTTCLLGNIAKYSYGNYKKTKDKDLLLDALLAQYAFYLESEEVFRAGVLGYVFTTFNIKGYKNWAEYLKAKEDLALVELQKYLKCIKGSSIAPSKKSANSSGGQWIVFDNNRANANIWRVTPNGTGLKQLTNSPFRDVEPAISPDGNWVVFSRWYGSDSSSLIKVRIDGSERTELLRVNFGRISSSSWSPDGRKIVMHIFYPDSGFADIYIINSDGSGFTQLTSERYTDEYPSINPQNGRIYFARGWGESKKIYSMRQDGSDMRLFLDFNTDFGVPKWDPTGTKLIVQTRYYPHYYYIFDFSTNDTLILHTPNGEDSDEASWSPDGKQIVLDVGNDNDHNRLYIYTLADSSYKLIGDFDGNRPTWGGK